MRTTIKHVTPDGQQSCPPDNDETDVNAQVWVFVQTGQIPHVQVAMEIAAWWQSPGYAGIDFAVFASTGTITHGLAEAIDKAADKYVGELQEVGDYYALTPWDETTDGDPADSLNALHALGAYVRECKVRPWTVGHNMTGYSPEPDNVTVHLDYDDAYEAFIDQLDRLAEHFADGDAGAHEDECDCEECSTLRFIEADLERFRGSRHFPARDGAYETYQISGHRTDAYWLTRSGEYMTYAEYLTEYNSN